MNCTQQPRPATTAPAAGRCIDKRLDVDASGTRTRLGWEPSPHLGILRRMPFLILNRRTYPDQWRARNHVSARHRRQRINMRIQNLIAANEDRICRRLDAYLTDPDNRDRFTSYLRGPRARLEERHRLLLRQLMCSTRAGDMAVFMNCCRHLAARWHDQGLSLPELGAALEVLGRICVATLQEAPEANDLSSAIDDHVRMTIQFAVDAIHEVHQGQAVPQT